MLIKSEIEKLKCNFMEGCAIYRPSGDEGKIAEWVKDYLRQLKIKSELDEQKNLFCKVDGEGEPLLLSAHLDVVPPCDGIIPDFKKGIFSSASDTVLGADDFAGVITILAAISHLRSNKISHRPLEILFTSMEEVGGLGVKKFDFSKISAQEGIVPDSITSVGTYITHAPTKYNFSLTFKGLPVHGQFVMKGVSAIQVMADLLHALPVGEMSKNTFLNIGTLQGGSALNTVAGNAKAEGYFKIFAEGEIRGEQKNICEKAINLIQNKISETQKKHPRATIDFDYSLNRPGYVFLREDPLIQKLRRAIRETGLDPKEKTSFGVSDANTLNAVGVKSVLIGTGAKNVHTIDESISLKDLVKLTELILNLVRSQ